MLFLSRRLGERTFIVNKKTGDQFEIFIRKASVYNEDAPDTVVQLGIHAATDFEINREELIHNFLLAPLAKSVISLAFSEKDYSCSYYMLFDKLYQHPKFPHDMNFNDFCKGLQALSIKFDEIKYFVRIALTNDTVRIFDNNFLLNNSREKESFNEV